MTSKITKGETEVKETQAINEGMLVTLRCVWFEIGYDFAAAHGWPIHRAEVRSAGHTVISSVPRRARVMNDLSKMATTNTQALPQQSALSNLLTSTGAKLPIDALPLELLHNLQYQHEWTNLRICSPAANLHTGLSALDISRPSPTSHPSTRHPPLKLITGTPPRHIYIHPDFQAHLILNSIPNSDVPIQPEWVLPMNMAEKWSLARLVDVFDSLPKREA